MVTNFSYYRRGAVFNPVIIAFLLALVIWAVYYSGARVSIAPQDVAIGTSTIRSSVSIESDRSSLAPSEISVFEKPLAFTGEANLGAPTPEKEYLVLQASASNKAPITLSGWRLESLSGRSARIGGGAIVAYNGKINRSDPIELAPGEQAVVTTGRSQIGTSFKANQCSLYLAQFQEFDPPLTGMCPSVRDGLPSAVVSDDRCTSFVVTLPRCEIPIEGQNMRAPDDLSDNCKAFIRNRLNYNGCVDFYQSRQGFFLPEWRVYLSKNEIFWGKGEAIKLIDPTGKTVDIYSR